MRILQVTEFFTPATGGSTHVAYELSKHLALRGHNVTVCSSDFGKGDSLFPDAPFEWLCFSSLPSRWKFYITPGLIPWTWEHVADFDVVHMHNLRTFQNAVVGARARQAGVPVVISCHGSLPLLTGHHTVKRAYDQLFGRRLMQSAARLVAVSEVEAEQYLQMGFPGSKISIIPNAIDLQAFERLPEPGVFRQKINIPSDKKLVLSLGRIHPIKGLDHLISAFARLTCSFADARLVIAGPDEGDLSRLRSMAKQEGVEKHTYFPGPLYGEEKLAALADADVVTCPSMYEIFGLVPFEALMCGTPVIVTDDTGSGQLIREAGAGYLVHYGDIDALSQALLRILTDQNQRSCKVKHGQEFIRERLAWDVIVVMLEKLYNELVKQRENRVRCYLPI